MDRTYRDAPAPGGGTPSVIAGRSPSGQRIPVTLKGPSQPGESCGALLGLVLKVGLGPDPGFPSAFDEGALKGKCALGPFLSILVIDCQYKCFCVNLCKVVDKVQIMSKGMFLDLAHCFMD
jgi:hypothetical protein